MKKTFLGGVVVLSWYVAAPFAQQQPATPPKTEPAHNVFVLTGCIKADADAKEVFKLTDASPIGQAPPARAAEAGSVGTSGQKRSYELRPVSGVNGQGLDADALKARAGQRVEVVVRPIELPAAPPATASIAVATAGVAKPTEPPQVRFNVTEVRRVIGSCNYPTDELVN